MKAVRMLGAGTVVFACPDRKVASKAKPFCSNCRILKFNVNRCRNPKLRKELFEMSEDLIRNAVFDSCQAQVFNPKIEASLVRFTSVRVTALCRLGKV